MRVLAATAPARTAHVPAGELRRQAAWAVGEAAVETLFTRAADGWELAVTHYRDLTADPPARALPVLLCHGLAANRLGFDIDRRYSLARFLTGEGYDVYSVELRGHGLSERPVRGSGRGWHWSFNDYCVRDLPAAYAAVLAHSGASRLHHIGHSMGGILLYARAALGEERVASGITIGSSLDYSGLPTSFSLLAPLAPLTHLSPRVQTDLPERVSALLTRLGPRFADPNVVDRRNVDLGVYRRMAATVTQPTSGRVLRDLARAIDGRGLLAEDGSRYSELLAAGGYTFPILAVSGSADPQCRPQTAARFGTEQAVFGRERGHGADYGHHDLIMGLRAPAEVWPLLAAWLARHDRST